MNAKTAAIRSIEAILLVCIVAIVLGAAIGQPVLFGYVETGSMRPTLNPSDGFVAIPASLAGHIGPGDVVTYKAEVLHAGGLTTHRVVGLTHGGFVTQGDANPVTDQATGEPPVSRDRIVAVALQFHGQLIKIPGLGTVKGGLDWIVRFAWTSLRRLGVPVSKPQTVSYVVLLVSIIGYVYETVRENASRERDRSTRRNGGLNAHTVVVAMTVLLVLTTTATMVVPSGTHQFDGVSGELDQPGIRVIPAGSTEQTTVSVANDGLLPVVTFLSPASPGIGVEPTVVRVPGKDSTNVTVTITAPPATGLYKRSLTHNRYLALLPRPILRGLYEIDYRAPIVVIDAIVGILFYLLGIVLVGTGDIRRRSRSRDVSLGTRLRNALRKLR